MGGELMTKRKGPGRNESQEEITRVRLPRNRETIGEIEELLGASRFRIACQDGRTRICRIPGKFRRRRRIMAGDLVIVKPWDIEPNEKGDIVWMYTRTQANWLRSKGHLK
jgi:translation initiation factor 1A